MNINLIAPIGYTGYGVTGLNVLKALVKMDVHVALFPLGQISLETEADRDIVQAAIKNQEDYDSQAQCIRIWHQFDMAQRVGSGRFTGMPIFELDVLKPNEIHHLKGLDEIVVCSEWAKAIVLDHMEANVKVAPLGVDREIFKPQESPVTLRTRPDNMVFLNIGKWEVRKGHDILGKVFMDTFSQTDPVELWMCPHNPFLTQRELDAWLGLYNSRPGQIKILERLKTQRNVADVMNAADVGVFPARAEGWNLELLEMMSCGKPVIATEYSAHTEFCGSGNSYQLPITELEPANDGKWFHGEGRWAKLDDNVLEQLSLDMKILYDKFHFGGLEVNEGGIETAKKFSWENTARRLLDVPTKNNR